MLSRAGDRSRVFRLELASADDAFRDHHRTGLRRPATVDASRRLTASKAYPSSTWRGSRPHGPKSAAPPPIAHHVAVAGRTAEAGAHLKESFRFGEVVAKSPRRSGRVDDRRAMDGRVRLAPTACPSRPMPSDTGSPADLNQLTPNVPHRVVLHVGCDDLFPYRIEYWRTDTGPEGQDLSQCKS